MFTITKIQQVDNQNRNKRRSASKEKAKKSEPFNKVLANELTQPPPKK